MAGTTPHTSGLGHDLRLIRERLAAADSSGAGPAASIATLLGEGFLPSAVLQAFVEGLRYSPLWLRFKRPSTQRAFVADSVDKSRTAFTCVARLCFLAVVSPRVFVQLFLFDAASDHKERALAGITVCAFLVTLAAIILEVLSMVVQLSSWAQRRMWGEPDEDAAARKTPSAVTAMRDVGIEPPSSRPLLSTAAHLSCSRPATTLPQVPSATLPHSVWTARTTRLYYITSEVTGLAVTLVPLVTMAVEYAISHDGGCAAGTLSIEADSSQAQRVFYCRFIVRPFIATTICFSMITRSPQFPLVLLSSAASIFLMIMRSFSVLSDPDVPSVLRVFQFLMVLILVLAHIVFRWVVDRAVLDEYVNRRTVEAHAEQLQYENAALEAFAAEKHPQLRHRAEHGRSHRPSLAGTSAAHFQHHGVVRVHDTSTAGNSPTAARREFSTANSTSTGSLSDLLAARDYSPTAVVVAVRLHDFARFGHRHGVRTATSIAAASVLARVHEVVCGVEGGQPDVTERHWDTYVAVFGLLDAEGETARSQQTLQRHALHGARCLAMLAALDERMSLQTARGDADFPRLVLTLHVGAILGEYPGTSASAQRYCHRGPGIDGALAMLASCRSSDNMILLSREAVIALGSVAVAATEPETIYEVLVNGDRFNAPPEATVQVHTSVSIELDELDEDKEARHVVAAKATPEHPSGPACLSLIANHPPSIPPPEQAKRGDDNHGAFVVADNACTCTLSSQEPRKIVEDDQPMTTGTSPRHPLLPIDTRHGASLATILVQNSHLRGSSLDTAAIASSVTQAPAGLAAVRTLDRCLAAASQLHEEVSELQNQRLITELTIPHPWIASLHNSPPGGLLPLRFSNPLVEHRFRNHFQQCGVLRLPNRVLDGFFLFLGLYTLIDFFVGVPFWDRHAAASFGQADELRLFSPKHVAALVLLLLWEALTLAGAVVRFRQRPVAWADVIQTAATTRSGALWQSLRDLWRLLLLSHTLRYTLFVIILLLFQPSTFSMNPSYATIIGIGAFYLEPIPQHRDLLRLFFRFGVPNGIILGMCFLLPLYLVEVFVGAFVIFWPIAALVGRLSQDRMDRAAFAVTERATAYREALRRQQGLREQVLDTAATPAMRQLLSTVHEAAMATSSSDEGEREEHPASPRNPSGGAPFSRDEERRDEDAMCAATRGPQMRGIRPDGPLHAAAAGRPAGYLHLEHTVVIGLRFDPLGAPNPIADYCELVTALACVQRAECFVAFLAVLDAIVEKHPPLSVIEARGELVMLGGPWGAAKAPPVGNEEAQHYAAAALAFLVDIRAAAAAMPHYGTAFTLTTAATAEDALVLMRSALYPSADLLGPGPERVMTLLRAAVPGASATTAALHRIARNPTSFASEEEVGVGAPSSPKFGRDATRIGSTIVGSTSSWAIREAGALVRVF